MREQLKHFRLEELVDDEQFRQDYRIDFGLEYPFYMLNYDTNSCRCTTFLPQSQGYLTCAHAQNYPTLGTLKPRPQPRHYSTLDLWRKHSSFPIHTPIQYLRSQPYHIPIPPQPLSFPHHHQSYNNGFLHHIRHTRYVSLLWRGWEYGKREWMH